NNGNTWNVLWDASTLTGGWSNYAAPIVISLADYAGQQVKIAWHADDPNTTNDGMWYNWFIDNVNVRSVSDMGETDGMKDRSDVEKPRPDVVYRQMYKIWRLQLGQEQQEQLWTLLTPTSVPGFSFSDNGIPTLPSGYYKWAVKAVYTNNVLSPAGFSNVIFFDTPGYGLLTGEVRNTNFEPVTDAVITAQPFTAVTNYEGVYSMLLPPGIYSVTCSSPTCGNLTYDNIEIISLQTTVRNFFYGSTNPEEEQVLQTRLDAIYPNPFREETNILFDVKETQLVHLEIFNIKGQKARTLLQEKKSSGQYQLKWDGRDDSGRAVAAGIYHCRMQCGGYQATKRMIFTK
ncbi:MAG: T9SS type A sorting domain-containing protein, partial [Candidatus Cloacimonetes bacterium]|nr:T9SS type A sorting domain-containing protein [Candidatus Cloacimonadota bacterium]